MNKLKNGFLDILFFIVYHSVFFIGTVVFLYTVNVGIPNLNLEYFKKFVFSKMGQAEVVEVRTIPIIQKIRGTVLVSDKTSSHRPAKEGEELKQGSTIETKEQSTALLLFGDKYTVRIRLGSRSQVNIDDLLRQDPVQKTEKSLINLLKGVVSLVVTNKGQAPQISIKSQGAVFGVRGTVFSVISDSNYSLLVVKEGKVEAENFVTSKKQMIESGATYLLNKEGQDQKIVKPEIVDSVEWNLDILDKEVPAMDQLVTLLGNPDMGPNPEQVAADKELQAKLDEIKIEIDIFKQYDKDLQDYLANDNQYLSQLQQLVNEETPKITNDIHCLSTSRRQCDLYSEKLLHSRDFPRTFGAPRLIQMLIAELKKYLKEQDDKLIVATKDMADLEALIAKRKVVLEEIEVQYNEKSSLETIIPRLKDGELLRKRD